MAEDRNDRALAAIEAALDGFPDPRFRARLRRSLLVEAGVHARDVVEAGVRAREGVEAGLQAREGVEAGLQARQEGNVRMTTSIDRTAVTPYLMTQDIEPVIAFAKQTFGAEEVHRSIGGAGGIHCELRIGDSVLFLGGAVPGEPVKPRLVGLHVYVADVDAVYQRALEAGGTSLGAPEDRPYGERAGFVKDPAGNHWYIATHTGPTYFAQEPRTVTPHLYVQRTAERGAPQFIDFLEAAFGAQVELRHDAPDGRVMHAVVRVHGAAMEIGEGLDVDFTAPAAFVVNVDDLDAAYEQAIAAGGTSLFVPATQSFGGRMAGVADPWGNEWFLAAR